MWKRFKSSIEDRAIWLILVLPTMWWVIWYIKILTNNNSATMTVIYGLVSTLIGALVGGFCSLAAAIYAGDQQIKVTMKRDIVLRMRERYYIPLYIEISCIYRNGETLLADASECLLCNEWEKIRLSAKVLGIPEKIISIFDELRNATFACRDGTASEDLWNNYREKCKVAHDAVEKIILKSNQVLGV